MWTTCYGLTAMQGWRNRQRRRRIAGALDASRTRRSSRRSKDFRYAELDSWSCDHRVIGTAEVTTNKAKPRFSVTSMRPADRWPDDSMRRPYCALARRRTGSRQRQLDLFADGRRAGNFRANLLRAGLPKRSMCSSARSAGSDWHTRSLPMHMRHDPAHAAESRCAGAHQRPASTLAMALRQPLAGEFTCPPAPRHGRRLTRNRQRTDNVHHVSAAQPVAMATHERNPLPPARSIHTTRRGSMQ